MIVLERQFTIGAPQQTVWEYLARAILSSPRLERIDIIDSEHFDALLRVKLGFINVPMAVNGQIADSVHLESLTAKLRIRFVKDLIKLNQSTTFTLSAVDEGQTHVACRVMIEGMGPLLTLFSGKVKASAEEIISGTQAYLERLS
ncbi:MAG: hypothetical protein HY675_12565 [Chloroflexi bacterium]|nr:hypothetical protein [Chloroflexota bacterium]